MPIGAGRRRTAALSVMAVLAVVGLAAACSSSGGTDAGPVGTGPIGTTPVVTVPGGDVKMGGRLVFGTEAESDGLDPTRGRWALAGMLVGYSIYDPMYAYDADGVARPYALESGVPSADFKTWTHKLRPGMKFHDGTPVNAAALKKQFDAFKASTLTGPALRLYDSSEVIDDLTVVSHLNAPWASLPNVLTGQGGALVSPATLDDPDGGRHPIGSGPFKFKEWTTDDHLTVVRNDQYWMKDKAGRQLPYLDEVVFKPIPEAQARVSSFEAGDFDIIHDDHPIQQARLAERAANGESQYVPDLGHKEKNFILLNASRPPLDDPLLRRALAYATEPAQYLEVTGTPLDAQADTAFEPDSKWHADVPFPRFDLAKANELMAQYRAKHGDGPVSFRLSSGATSTGAQIVQLFQHQWERIGVTVQPEALEQITLIAQAVSGTYDAIVWRQFGAPDPDGDWHFWTGHNSSGTFALNFSRLQDDELDRNLDIGRASDDFATRKAAYDIVQQRWADLVPYIWLDFDQWVVAASNRVHGIGSNDFPDGTKAQPFYTGANRLTATWVDPPPS